ncbi:hypothetical protein O1L68_06930 [Streptomyces lydicus]|nr:hypothetical protein [Streptomyces lydicus]
MRRSSRRASVRPGPARRPEDDEVMVTHDEGQDDVAEPARQPLSVARARR